MKTRSMLIILALVLALPAAARAEEMPPMPLIMAKPLVTLNSAFKVPYKHPSKALFIAESREIAVLDGVNNRIVIHGLDGAEHSVIGSRVEDSIGRMQHPLGFDRARDGSFYVADSGHAQLMVFDAKGNFQRIIAIPAAKGEKHADPTDVVGDWSKGVIYVVDNDAHRVGAYSLSAKKWNFAGGVGQAKDKFRYPFLAAMGPSGNVHVVDMVNARVKVLGPDLKFVRQIGDWGVKPGQFYRPKGVAVDGQGRVFVTDSYIGVVEVFAENGAFLGALADSKGVLHFNGPVGLAVSADNKTLAVVEMLASKVSLWQLVK